MLFTRSGPARLPETASPLPPAAVWPRGSAGMWIAGIGLVLVLTSWLSGQVWLGVSVGVAGMVLTVWHLVKTLAVLRGALDRLECERSAVEEALRRSQRMAALGRLTVGVAHDFNNHLTVIGSNVEMLARGLDGTQLPLRRHVDATMQGVRRAAALTGRLLSLSRQSAPEPEPVDVNRLLGGLFDLLQRTLGDRIILKVVECTEPWFTWVDVDQMENALLSLAVAACDRLRGGSTLIVAVSNVHEGGDMAGSAPGPGDYIQIAIDDFEAAKQTEGWRPADDLTHTDLAVTRAFVQESGGRLFESGRAISGLSLRLFLPRYVSPASAVRASPRTMGQAATILVVVDDAGVRASCVEILRGLKYSVLEAADAMEAFQLIADQGGIDLLFTDLDLPNGVDGRALADAARNAVPGIRVLFTTGSDGVAPFERVEAARPRKPFDPAQLAAKVRDVLASEHTAGRSETIPAVLFRQ